MREVHSLEKYEKNLCVWYRVAVSRECKFLKVNTDHTRTFFLIIENESIHFEKSL